MLKRSLEVEGFHMCQDGSSIIGSEKVLTKENLLENYQQELYELLGGSMKYLYLLERDK